VFSHPYLLVETIEVLQDGWTSGGLDAMSLSKHICFPDSSLQCKE
jgi:hypothetical protein